MPCSPAANDNRGIGFAFLMEGPVRATDRLRAEILDLQATAERASLDGLAFILTMAVRGASRVADWEHRVISELEAC